MADTQPLAGSFWRDVEGRKSSHHKDSDLQLGTGLGDHLSVVADIAYVINLHIYILYK